MSHTFDQTSNTFLRGGPAMKLPGDTEASFNLWSDHSKDMRFSLGGWINKGDESHYEIWNAWCSMVVRPSNALQVSISPDYTRNLRDLQYVGTDAFGGEDRYLFGHLDQRTFSLTFRVDYCVTPNLTIQYYGSPFVSSARYGDFKRITDPKEDGYHDRYHAFDAGEIAHDAGAGVYDVDEDGDGATDYAIDDPDFNYRDFNSNLVVRWEYRPGSTLFVVWSQSRSDFISDGTFDLDGDLDSLFGIHPHDVFLVKFNRWFSL
ncbi:hypothetical protein H8E07_14520 [bacterium]|nr:hypothetical protein [bacterium]